MRLDPSPTSAATVRNRVTFTEPVDHVAEFDFSLTGANGAQVNSLSGGPSVYHITIETWLDATLTLNFVNRSTVTDPAGNFAPAKVIGTIPYVIDTTPPGVGSIVVNDGAAQRSRVTSLTVTFTDLLTLGSSAFVLSRTGPGSPTGNVSCSVSTTGSTATQTVARLTFSGSLTQATSRIDGLYTLTVLGHEFTDLVGQTGTPATKSLHRLFGDADGNRTVDATALLAFRLAILGTGVTFDSDGSGQVDATGFLQFRLRFLMSV